MYLVIIKIIFHLSHFNVSSDHQKLSFIYLTLMYLVIIKIIFHLSRFNVSSDYENYLSFTSL